MRSSLTRSASTRRRAVSLAGHFGAFVAGWADFDAAAFNTTPAEAGVMDPQQRVLLEV